MFDCSPLDYWFLFLVVAVIAAVGGYWAALASMPPGLHGPKG